MLNQVKGKVITRHFRRRLLGSPSRDLVIAWFGASNEFYLNGYARAIATSGLFK